MSTYMLTCARIPQLCVPRLRRIQTSVITVSMGEMLILAENSEDTFRLSLIEKINMNRREIMFIFYQ